MRLLLSCLALLCALAPGQARAQVGISPPILEMRLDQPARIHTLRLQNFETRERQVKVSVVNWTLDDAGNVVVLPPTEQSLDRWVIISPLSFTLKARSVQTVRVAVRPALALPAGEHRAMVYFDEVLPAVADKPGMRGRFRIGAAIYAYQGEPVRAGTLTGLRIDAGRLHGSFDSRGNAHVRLGGHFGIWRAGSFPGVESSPLAGRASAGKPGERPTGLVADGDLPSLPALAGSTRKFVMDLPAVEPGEYVLEFRGNLSGQAHAEAIRFTVPRPKPGP